MSDNVAKAFKALGNLDDGVGRVYFSAEDAYDAYQDYIADVISDHTNPFFTFSGWLHAKQIRILEFDSI